MRTALIALACAPCFTACNLLSPDRSVVLSSAPPGATVYVDGRDTGFATPCELALDTDEDLRLDFELPGFVTERRLLTAGHEAYAVLWRESNVGPATWNFPLFLALQDFIVPVKWNNTQRPWRLHIDLRRAADAPSTHP